MEKANLQTYLRYMTTHLQVSDCVLISKSGHSYNKSLCIDLGQLFTRGSDIFTEGLSVYYERPGCI